MTQNYGIIDENNPLVKAEMDKGINSDVAIGNVMMNLNKPVAPPTVGYGSAPPSNLPATSAPTDNIANTLKGMGIDLTGVNTSVDLSSLFSGLTEEQKQNIKKQQEAENEAQIASINVQEQNYLERARTEARASEGALRAGLGISGEFGAVDTAAVFLISDEIKRNEKAINLKRDEFAAQRMLLSAGQQKAIDDRIATEEKILTEQKQAKWDMLKNIFGIQQQALDIQGQKKKLEEVATPAPFFSSSDLTKMILELPVGQTKQIQDPNTNDTYTIEGMAQTAPNIKSVTSTNNQTGEVTITAYEITSEGAKIVSQVSAGKVGNRLKGSTETGKIVNTNPDIETYVSLIGQNNPSYVDENGNVKWASVPEKYRTEVLNRIMEEKSKQPVSTEEKQPWYMKDWVGKIPFIK